MAVLAGPFLASAALLGVGGALKAYRPATTARALGSMGLPSAPLLVRLGGAAEVGVAAGALAWASPPFAVAVAVSYLGFAGFVVAAMARRVPLSSCGCFGRQDTPPTYGHVALDLAAAGVAAAVALGPGGAALADVGSVGGSIVLRAVFVAMTVTCAWFAYVALSLLPQLSAAGRRTVSVAGRRTAR